MLLKNFVAAYQSLREACAILGFLSQRILNEGSNWTQKNNRMFMQITNSRKKQRHTIRKFVFRENSFYQLIDSSVTVYFAVNFQTTGEKPVFSHHFPQSLVLSLLCLHSHVLRDVIRVVFW